jgi:hypothetical protein
MRVQEIEQQRWLNGGQMTGSMVQREHSLGDYELILGERDQRILNMIDN